MTQRWDDWGLVIARKEVRESETIMKGSIGGCGWGKIGFEAVIDGL